MQYVLLPAVVMLKTVPSLRYTVRTAEKGGTVQRAIHIDQLAWGSVPSTPPRKL